MPPWVPGYNHDVFVSYAYASNLTPTGCEPGDGWCTRFRASLQQSLSPRLDLRDDDDIWLDKEVKGYERFNERILGVLDNSAILVVLLSPAYLRSKWCLQELKTFIEHNHGADAVRGRIFVVRMYEMDDAELPPCIRRYDDEVGIDGYQFYDDNGLFGAPLPDANRPKHDPFFAGMERFATDLADQLNQMRESDEMVPIVAAGQHPGGNGPAVYLAEVSMELEIERLELAAALQSRQPPIRIVNDPERLFQREGLPADEIRQTVGRGLSEECTLFVQLFGRSPTARTEQFPDGYDGFEYQSCLELDNPPKVIRWRHPGVMFDAVTDDRHRNNIFSNVISCELQELKHLIANEADMLAQARRQDHAAVGRVLIDAAGNDRSCAEVVKRRLARVNVAAVIREGDDKTPLSHFFGDLDFSGLMMIYGHCDQNWIPMRVYQTTKLPRKRNGHEIQSAIYYCQPPPRLADRPLGCRADNLREIHHDDAEAFQRFVADVSLGEAMA